MQCPRQQHVWDCATGNGQAAVALADHFEHVVATDASATQIAAATSHPRVNYHQAPAEHSGLADHSMDLVTVAQALHWFDLPAFYAEVQRVLKPDGLIAVWAYAVLEIDEPAVHAIVDHYYDVTLEPYWMPQRRWVEEGYRELAFPFTVRASPAFYIEQEMDLLQLLGYLSTWSATQKYRAERMRGDEAQGAQDPLRELYQALTQAWPAARTRVQVRWPLHLRLGDLSRAA